MLRIRLARAWRKKTPFFRIVLTEHSRPTQTGFKSILWWYNPYKKTSDVNTEEIKKHIENWAKPTERVAKILFSSTKDELFKKYFNEKNIQKKKKNPDKKQ